MKRVFFLSLVVALTATLLASKTPDAYACSIERDFDLVEDSDLVVAGRFTGWELDTDWGGTDVYDPQETGGLVFAYAGIRAKMLVDRIFKGTAPSEITVTSGNSVDVYDHDPKYVWVGPSGACGAFGSDPTDKYAIMGLTNEADGTFGAFIFSWFYIGDEPPTNYDDRGLIRLSPLLPGYSPGSVPTGTSVFWPAVALAVLSPLAVLGGTMLLVGRTSQRKSIG